MMKRYITRVVKAISVPATDENYIQSREAAIRMATATLMIDIARADHVFDESEFDSVLELITSHFKLDAEQCNAVAPHDETSRHRL